MVSFCTYRNKFLSTFSLIHNSESVFTGRGKGVKLTLRTLVA